MVSSARPGISSRSPLVRRLLSTLPMALPLSLRVTGKTNASRRWQAVERTTSWESESFGVMGQSFCGRGPGPSWPSYCPEPRQLRRSGRLGDDDRLLGGFGHDLEVRDEAGQIRKPVRDPGL